MAKATNFLSQTSGKLDDMFQTRQTDHGTFLVRNPRRKNGARLSLKQAIMRCQGANVSANYRLYKNRITDAFENKTPGQNDYNIFIQVNYDKNPVFITKQDSRAGGCVLAGYQYSRGSLPPVASSINTNGVLVSALELGGLVIDDDTTVADFATAVIQNNTDWDDLDQITFFFATQWVDEEQVPRVRMTSARLVLNTADNTKLWDLVPALGFSTVLSADTGSGRLGMNTVLSNAGASWMHIRPLGNGRTLVSTQRLKVVNDILASYQTEEALRVSADSYGGINTKDDTTNASTGSGDDTGNE